MHLSETLEGFRRCIFHADGIGNITDDALHLRTEITKALDCRREGTLLDVGEYHIQAGLRKGLAEGEADAVCAACYKRGPANEVPH